MASLVLSAAHRSLRIGFLVRANEIRDVEQAASLNTGLWGGIYNPMIPVGVDDGLARQLVRLYRVDVLHPVTDDENLKSFMAGHPHLAWPECAPDESGLLERNDKGRWFDVLDMRPWYQRKWPQNGYPFRTIRWDGGMDALASLFVCLFGAFPAAAYRDAYVKELAAEETVIAPGLALPGTLATDNAPIGATRTRLVPDSIIGWNQPGVYVGDPRQAADLVPFWNLRAAGSSLAFCPLEPFEVERMMAYLTGHIEWCARWARQAPGRRLSAWASRGYIVPESVRRLYPDDVPTDIAHVDRSTWNGLNVRPAVYRLDPQSVLANVEIAADGAPALDFQIPPIVDVQELPAAHRSQQFVTAIQPLTELDYEGYTLRLPRVADLNEWYSRETWLVPNRVRADVRDLGVIRRLYEYTVHARPVGFARIISRLFERAGIASVTSHAGRIVQQLISQMSGLEGCRVFKIRGVRKLINSEDARGGVTRGAATAIIFDKDAATGTASFDRYQRLFVEGRPLSSADEAFNHLLRRGVFRPGLTFPCPKCTLEFWHALPIDETARCSYCGHTFGVAPLLKDRGDWRFRLSGLFGREGREEGGIPVTLTLLQLQRLLGMTTTLIHVSGMDLRAPGLACEVDLAVLSSERDGELEIALGECKGAGEITDEDVQNIVTAGQRLEDSGLAFFPLFAKTADSFLDAELARFRSLVGQGIKPVLFTARELEPYHPYYDSPEQAPLALPHASNLQQIARNSQTLYLQ